MIIKPPEQQRIYLITALTAVGIIFGGCNTQNSHLNTFKDDLLQLPGNMWQDSKQMVGQTENVAILLIGGGASGYVRYDQDDRIADHFWGHHTFSRDFTIGVGAAGNPTTHFALAGAGYMYGLLADQEQTRQVSGTLVEALALNGLLTVGLKLIAQDKTPNEEYYGWPSGHTSSTVTFATVMNEYYGPWVGMPLYA